MRDLQIFALLFSGAALGIALVTVAFVTRDRPVYICKQTPYQGYIITSTPCPGKEAP
jgi:hypothetical protein